MCVCVCVTWFSHSSCPRRRLQLSSHGRQHKLALTKITTLPLISPSSSSSFHGPTNNFPLFTYTHVFPACFHILSTCFLLFLFPLTAFSFTPTPVPHSSLILPHCLHFISQRSINSQEGRDREKGN